MEFQFEGLADFLYMGGSAFYVWTCYVFFSVVMGWNLIAPVLERRKVMSLLKARVQREVARSGLTEAGE